jgi:hypothetical protein
MANSNVSFVHCLSAKLPPRMSQGRTTRSQTAAAAIKAGDKLSLSTLKIHAANTSKVIKNRNAKPALKVTGTPQGKSQRRISSFGFVHTTKSTTTTTTEDKEEVHEREVVEAVSTTTLGDSTTTVRKETTFDRTTIVKTEDLETIGNKRKLSGNDIDDEFLPTKAAKISQELKTLDRWATERPRRKTRVSVTVSPLDIHLLSKI